ncbi:hypothetical protein B2J93_8800 [Marssonina coronariae]|uniref:Uncharacterized protein n=1 Tax=Diplocarpon coronariae TaxID=2795749 RepID=A0A218YWS4_9HELO|nr:hypothetical protein B2J93_8800 [Marssonina coronariae]
MLKPSSGRLLQDPQMEDETISERRRIQNREAQRRYRENIKRKLRMADVRNRPPISRRSNSWPAQASAGDKSGEPTPVQEIEYFDGENDLNPLNSFPSLDMEWPWYSFAGIHDHAKEPGNYSQPDGTSTETLEFSPNSSTIIHLAAKKGYHNIVRMLSEAGVDVSVKDDTGQTSLHLAALCGHSDTVLVLLDAGADIDAENQQGQTALFMAVDSGQECTVKILLEAGANPNVKTGTPVLRGKKMTIDPRLTRSTLTMDNLVEQ